VAQALSSPLPRRLEWALSGTAALGLVAEDAATGALLGSVQFVRSRRDAATWMFGHWRVAPALRRKGVGRLLLERGTDLLPAASRLYSYVDWGNEGSIAAHLKLGFEAAPEVRGAAALGALSTIGAAAPALRLTPVPRGAAAGLFPVYRRAMGGLWLRLFPRLDAGNFLAPWGRSADPRRLLPNLMLRFLTRLWAVGPGTAPAGLLAWDQASITLFLDPAACDAALLARVAIQVLGLGAPRERLLEMRGLSRDVVSRSGPIMSQVLMGKTEIGALRSQRSPEPIRGAAPPAP
jgi:GNAT superfamily N-acetyltransferase